MPSDAFEKHFPLRKPSVWGGPGTVERFIGSEDIAAVRSAIAEGIDVNEQDEHGQTLLSIAASVKSPEIVKLLLEAGANPNICDDGQSGPLTSAVRNARVKHIFGPPPINEEVVALLLDAGANPDMRDEFGQTPAQRVGKSRRLRRLFRKHGYAGDFE